MLTEDQKRLLITLIEKGQPLPAEYRRQLFATDDSEYVRRPLKRADARQNRSQLPSRV